jgi:hypothetical protein
MMASAYMVLPGLINRQNIAGKIENGRVYVCLSDMAQDSGKSLHEYGLLKTTKDYINKLAAQEGVPYHNYYQATAGAIWAPEPLARHFGKWLDPLYDGFVSVLCQHLWWVQEGDMLSKFRVSFAVHRERDVQKAQSETFNRWVNRHRDGDFSQVNNEVLVAKTGRTSAQWQAEGAAIDPPVPPDASAPEIIFRLDPDLAAELSLMKCLMVQEGVSLDEANRRSHDMRLAFQCDASGA